MKRNDDFSGLLLILLPLFFNTTEKITTKEKEFLFVICGALVVKKSQ
jgi:hypothetical protein